MYVHPESFSQPIPANVAARAAAAESGRDGQKTVKANTFTGMSLEVCACVCRSVCVCSCMRACMRVCVCV